MVPNADAEPWGPHQLLSMAARLIQRRQDQALADLGLTHAAVIALQGLTAGPLNQERLAADIKVRSQSLGRVLTRLEEAGLVSRTLSSHDRRSNEVAITESGLQALAAARRVEKDVLPPDVVEGAVLSRELARVISYFPGSPRLGAKQVTEPAAEALTSVPEADKSISEADRSDATAEKRPPEPVWEGGALAAAEVAEGAGTAPEAADTAAATGVEEADPGATAQAHPDQVRTDIARPDGNREN
ncbi:MarR family winged helix-turn-helix transcriptional regulator [Arthrobacter sp. ISL-28]|uniref:MarR family winged helix-turn-helix transcriptional regulator n=1 Tax=Arthrobacter sp. ISL-28 TaxID=2819108 RepID=UPI001BE7185E|nr:MarR family transcriptional regulator [Arthrobacter sp. ISL-28]MBT2520345.1 MarR family transcriptional regulator [Arthrobacter sp. ISL-28]